LQTGFAQDVRNDMDEGIRLLETKLSESEMSQVMDFLNLYYKTSASIQTCVVHGDFYYDNIFWDEKTGRLGVIDFNEGGIEDPALDFMYSVIIPKNSEMRYLRSMVQKIATYMKEANYMIESTDCMIWLKLSKIILGNRIFKKGIKDFLKIELSRKGIFYKCSDIPPKKYWTDRWI